MHATGIICEYNPFHNGHQHHILQTRQITNCDVLVCVMSGNFVQRGEPAVIDKWTRTKSALQHGVDLVIELPFPFATQSAKQFAQGAIASLALANVSDFVFGSETNDIEVLQKLANIDASNYRDLMQDGLSPTRAYELIYGNVNANDILGINYLQVAKKYTLKAYSIKRTNQYHDETISSTIASATAIRKAIHQHQSIERVTCMHDVLDSTYAFEHYYPYLQSLLLSMSPEDLKTIFLMDEGIEMHLIKCAKVCDTLDNFLQMATTKRYSTSRIRRTLLHLLNQTKKTDIDTLPPLQHIRVLGFNEIGKKYLKSIKCEELIIASRFNQIPLPFRNMEMKATQLYGLVGNRKELVAREIASPVYLP